MTALLTDNLPLLAGAPNGIKKLRELILELAVRGKLVEQDNAIIHKQMAINYGGLVNITQASKNTTAWITLQVLRYRNSREGFWAKKIAKNTTITVSCRYRALPEESSIRWSCPKE